MRYWLTTNWPPERGTGRAFTRVWVPDRLRDDAVRVRPDDIVFVYETKTGPKRKQEVDGEEFSVDRETGRQGIIAMVRVRAEMVRRADTTKYDGKNYGFTFSARTEPIWDSGFASPAVVRRALGWDVEAPIRNIAFRQIEPPVAARLQRVLGYRDDAPRVRERRGTPTDEIAEEEDRKGTFQPGSDEDERKRILASIKDRRGQPEFRRKLIAVYGGRCAMSGCDFSEALEACHIVPHSGPSSHRVVNGLLLRADLHTLFDRGWIGVDPDTSLIIVHPELVGTAYGELAGRPLRLPAKESLRPSRDALLLHACDFGLLAPESVSEPS